MYRVLVVEDDIDLNKTVCSFLRQHGYEVTGALTVMDAYDEMEKSLFDVIISDIMMPGKDGFEFAEEIRAADKDIPILFILTQRKKASG